MRNFSWTIVCGLLPVTGFLIESTAHAVLPGDVLVVDINTPASTQNQDGEDWSTAFADIQPAIDKTQLPDSPFTDIWVAAGTYKPTYLSDTIAPIDPRSATFRLEPGIALYAGFAGTESLLSESSYQFNPTILSGDLDGDDAAGFQNYDDNAYHVVTAFGTNDDTRLEGFTITGGFANGTGTNESNGAGIITDRARFVRCTIKHNWAVNKGGGAYSRQLDSNFRGPNFVNCHFIENRAAPETGSNDAFGGAIAVNDQAVAGSLNCRYVGNTAQNGGGAIWVGSYNSNLEPDHNMFINNSTLWGNPDAGVVLGTNGRVDVRNSILWCDGGAEIDHVASGAPRCSFGSVPSRMAPMKKAGGIPSHPTTCTPIRTSSCPAAMTRRSAARTTICGSMIILPCGITVR